MTRNEFTRLFPNASPDAIAANAHDSQLPERPKDQGRKAGSPAADGAKLERHTSDGTLGARKAERRNAQRFLVRVTSVRRRLLDEDNLCEKYAVDLCRYAGALPSDCAGEARIEVAQRKAGKEEDEHTVVEIFELIEA